LDGKNKQEIVRLLANLNISQGTTIIVVTHDSRVAAHTERILLLDDGRITKEKLGLHMIKKKHICPYCQSTIQVNDTVCPSCQKKL
jgi:ABC-type lipoprotein export system ATPase subunit